MSRRKNQGVRWLKCQRKYLQKGGRFAKIQWNNISRNVEKNTLLQT